MTSFAPSNKISVMPNKPDLVGLDARGATAVSRQPLDGDRKGLRARDRHVGGCVWGGSLDQKGRSSDDRRHVVGHDALVHPVVRLVKVGNGHLAAQEIGPKFG